MRVLIVEDDPSLRPLQRELVESLGHEVDEATNAVDALAMLKGDPEIELVLLDLGLPPDPQGISEGVRFLKEARLWNAFLKVVVVTGQSHDDALLTCVEEVIERLVRTVLVDTGFNVSETARRLNISREHLYYYIKKYGIQRPDSELF